MSENKPSDKSDSDSNPFAAAEDMPTVTTLLARRKLQRAEPAASSPAPATSRIKASARGGERRAATRLEVWSEQVLGSGLSPETNAARVLLAEKADWVLVLLKSEEDGFFEARAVAGGSRERWALWTGLRLGESASPAVWQEMRRAEFLNLSAKTATHAGIRGALGCPAGEQAWAFWIGPPEKPLGLLLAGASSAEMAAPSLQKAASLLR